jgi:Caspase domain
MKYILHVEAEEARSCHMSSNQDKNSMVTDRESIRKSRRFAVVVGVNKYQESDEIPILAGAENDAEELRRRLTNNNNNFEVLDGHFLLGEHATRTAILKAISDILHNEIDTELVIFYFSGHGVLDEKQELYIAPYDMYPKDPFVSGIRMEDLKDFIDTSDNKANVAIILDCCYAGIVTKGTKGPPNENEKHLVATLQNQVQKFGKKPSQDDAKPRPAKIILASSEGDAVSREKNNCTHTEDIGKPPHPHGAFSFHLLEGLAGAAAHPDTGIITFDSLRKYIEDKMTAEKKQKPMYALAEASLLEYIIGTRQEVFDNNVKNLITKIQKSIIKGKEVPQFIDIRILGDAVKKVSNLSALDPNNVEIPHLVNNINDSLKQYQQALDDWLSNNTMIAGKEIDKIARRLYSTHFYEISENLTYEGFQKLNELDLEYLVHLTPEIEDKIEYTSEDDKRLKRLHLRLDSATKRGKLGTR